MSASRLGLIVAALLAWSYIVQGQCAPKTIIKDSAHGIIHDGSGGGNHADRESCLWFIQGSSPSHIVSLNFLEFVTECSWDVVIVYDGPSTSAPVLAMLSGDFLPEPIVSSTHEVVVRFNTDQQLNYDGFTFEYFTGECGFNCSGRGACNAGVCECESGWGGPYCEREWCPNGCSGRGTCSPNGVCECDLDLPYWGHDCNTKEMTNAWHEDVPHIQNVTEYYRRRSGHAMVTDAAGRLYVYGGYSLALGELGDFIRYDFDTGVWSELVASGDPPPALSDHSMARFPGTSVVVVVFGYSGGDLETGSLWYVDVGGGSDVVVWTKADPPSPKPVRRIGSAVAATDSDRLFAYGGYSRGDGYLNDLWLYSRSSETWTQLSAKGTAPLHRAFHSLTFLGTSATPALLLFGGSSLNNDFYADTRVYWVNNNVWANMIPIGTKPTGRFGQATVRVSSDMLLMFGGRRAGNTCFHNDMWAYNFTCNRWVAVDSGNVNNTAEPSGRYLTAAALTHSAVGLGTEGALVLFGGFRGVSLADTWEYVIDECDGESCPYDTVSCPMRCTSYAECVSCSADPECGWCFDFGSCVVGTVAGPTTGGTCGEWTFDSCAASSCTVYDNCGDCIDDSGCEWCDGDCQDRSDSCSATAYTSVCPSACNAHECSDCLDSSECDYCVWSGTCAKSNECGSGGAISDVSECPARCETHTTCDDCTAAYPFDCMWCPTLDECIYNDNFLHHSRYGECFDWNIGIIAGLGCLAPCSAHTDCDACTLDTRCGWCGDSGGTCMEGGFDAPAPSAGSCSSWDFATCPCVSPVDCTDCVSDSRCGWCVDTATCVDELASSWTSFSSSSSCSVYESGSCYDCSIHPDCSSCTADPLCGFCHKTGECMRGGPDGTVACPGEPLSAAWDFSECRTCPSTPNCTECVSVPGCGFCATTHECSRGDLDGAFDDSGGACSAWDYSLCNSVCAARHSDCSTCVADPDCGWCCDTNSCGAGDCSFFHPEVCPSCNHHGRCAECANDLCCGWCDGVDECVRANSSGPLEEGACGVTGSASLDEVFYNEGECPFRCEDLRDCGECVVSNCSWCGKSCVRHGLAAGREDCHVTDCLKEQNLIEYTPDFDVRAPMSTTTIVAIYAVVFFIITLVGVSMLVIVVRRFEAHYAQAGVNEDVPNNRRRPQQPHWRPPIVIVYVPGADDDQKGLAPPPTSNPFFIGAAHVTPNTRPRTAVCAVIRFPSDTTTIADNAGVANVAVGVALDPQNLELPEGMKIPAQQRGKHRSRAAAAGDGGSESRGAVATVVEGEDEPLGAAVAWADTGGGSGGGGSSGRPDSRGTRRSSGDPASRPLTPASPSGVAIEMSPLRSSPTSSQPPSQGGQRVRRGSRSSTQSGSESGQDGAPAPLASLPNNPRRIVSSVTMSSESSLLSGPPDASSSRANESDSEEEVLLHRRKR